MPNTTLAELKRTKAPAVLLELAYHDNYDDAQWIINNIEAIGANLALSVADYLGVVLWLHSFPSNPDRRPAGPRLQRAILSVHIALFVLQYL